MSDTYFCFSDECGDYKIEMTARQLRAHPYYIRATFLINAKDWKRLNNDFKTIKEKYNIPPSYEVKWSYLWKLRKFQNSKKEINSKDTLYPIKHLDYHELINFVDEVLSLLNDIDEIKILLTYTKNNSRAINEKSILKWHIQEHMQRIEMELEVDEENLGVIFIDPVNNEKNHLFREIYHELFENGDFIKKYSHIKDSLNIEYSHHSVGIQISDFIAGVFSAVLKSPDFKTYQKGIEMFFNYLIPNLRKNQEGEIQGYGIREVKKDGKLRKELKDKIQRLEESIKNS